MTDVFDILALPTVPLRQILGGVLPADLFELIQCSTKTLNTFQGADRNNKTFKIGVDFQRNWVEIRGVHKYYSQEKKDGDKFEKTKKFGGNEVPIDDAEAKAFNTYWGEGDRRNGTKMIAEHFIEMLAVNSLDQIFISENEPALEILEWVDKQNVTMENFNLIGAPKEDADAIANHIFSPEFMRKVSVNFTSLLEVPDDFKPTKWTTEQITMSKFQLQHAHWFKLEHLKLMNVGAIILYHCTLTNDDVYNFLNEWKSGRHQKFMYMSLHLKDDKKFDFKEILKDLAGPNAKIETPADGQESIVFTSVIGKDTKEIELELKDGKKHFVAFVG